MNTWAAAGVRCVCIDDDWGWLRHPVTGETIPTRVPMLNEVLTIATVAARDGEVFLTFREIPFVQTDGGLSGTVAWSVRCFRPLEERKTDISIFTKILDTASKELVDV